MTQCGETCAHPYPAPAFVRALKVPCARYGEWLEKQAQSCRLRDKREGKPGIEEYRKRIHQAVLASEGRDFYTGEPLEWNRLNHVLPLSGGRKRHLQRGHYPSVDHYTGTSCLDFRLCSALVNHAKGPLSHQQFLELCQKVVSQRQRREAAKRAA